MWFPLAVQQLNDEFVKLTLRSWFWLQKPQHNAHSANASGKYLGILQKFSSRGGEYKMYSHTSKSLKREINWKTEVILIGFWESKGIIWIQLKLYVIFIHVFIFPGISSFVYGLLASRFSSQMNVSFLFTHTLKEIKIWLW